MANLDLKTSALILDRAFIEAKSINDNLTTLIISVLKGHHKTYRYILLTALLAKATNEKIDALSLQKGDGKKGKFDARTLCHKVIVPFERLKLPGSIGDSNEPFLNKPARFTKLSITNAVRSGRDKAILNNVILILSSIKTSEEAYKYLKFAMVILKANHEAYLKRFAINDGLIDVSDFSQLVLDYIYTITEHSSEGEVCPLVVAEIERLYLGKEYKVVPHNVNESGASTKEVGDIDIYDSDGNLVNAIEVKDKNFSEQDVLHAISKFRQVHLNSSLFIYGKKASFDEDSIYKALKKVGREGHYCCMISILNYAKLRIYDMKTVTVREFVEGLLKFSQIINAKENTVSMLRHIASQIFG